MTDFKGFLIDLDGVLYVGNRAICGAKEAIEFLTDEQYKFRFVSNTTRKSRTTITRILSLMGIDIPEKYLFTPPMAAIAYMKKTGKMRYYLLTTGDVEKDFDPASRCIPPARPDFVVIGDAGEKITYDTLNTAFRFLMEGTELIALEKDRYWMSPDGLSLSAGPLVAALEFASGKTAAVMGKPSAAFFELALQDMGLSPGHVAMIGDDINTDIGGGKQAGMCGVLVRTGKYRKESADSAAIKPDYIIDSIAQIRDIL
ncbi:TIGR01458 family HAD-type hydrolase [uncultured Methanoregula sp.]|uniref:TIGR01458 family HAD-type hydrolase n=1 Tax=uncultured Methanoregula sp. TaxID=1005933 RepID=UPI002AAB4B23|nr:TIGR01458 family HAD-type hydrolase [uncultured Methanoregula sp.]